MRKVLGISLFPIVLLLNSCSSSQSNDNAQKTDTIVPITTQDDQVEPNGKLESSKKITLDSFIDLRDNKKYAVVKIGEQDWMAENLCAIKFRNGEKIPHAKSIEDWIKAGENKKPAWCYYENNEDYGKQYGVLYNWYAVADKRQIAPKGFHIPSEKEWEELDTFLGKDNTGTKMKTTFGCERKKDDSGYEGDGSNASQFSGLPSGTRGWSGKYFNLGHSGYWWTSTEDYGSDAWYRSVRCSYSHLNHWSYSKLYGMSVRCLKDSSTISNK